MLLLQLGILFGQMNRQPNAGGGGAGAGGFLGICLCEGLLFVLAIGIQILFLLNLSRTLEQCSRRNRTMEPGMVWLNLIPLFNIVWIIITVLRMSESLQNEYRSRGMRSDDPEFGKMTGILYVIFSFVCGPVGLIFFIMYWMKIANYKNELIAGGRGGAEDDYDDGPRRRRRREEDDDFDDEDDRPRRRRDEEE